ncbi:MAG: hypothetical protein F4Z81_09325 [Gemmatimonadetes bacterium]|nr:hypothetical protein [Gemmatimonadota bacterium]MYB62387.1 hypothetical protein [Gemmatimonadota bacterium]
MKRMIKDLLFCLAVSAATAAIPAAGVSTLLSMTGIIEDDRALIWIFLALALPIFVFSYMRVTRRPR